MKNRIKELRQRDKLTLKQLSQKLKQEKHFQVSDGQLSLYENDKRQPRDPNIWKHIANIFNVSVPYLLGYTENPNTETDKMVEEMFNYIEKSSNKTKGQINVDFNNATDLLSDEKFSNLSVKEQKVYFKLAIDSISKKLDAIVNGSKQSNSMTVDEITDLQEPVLELLLKMNKLNNKLSDSKSDN